MERTVRQAAAFWFSPRGSRKRKKQHPGRALGERPLRHQGRLRLRMEVRRERELAQPIVDVERVGRDEPEFERPETARTPARCPTLNLPIGAGTTFGDLLRAGIERGSGRAVEPRFLDL